MPSLVFRYVVPHSAHVPSPLSGSRTPHWHIQPMRRAGTPAMSAYAGTSRVTTAPAPTNANSPSVDPHTPPVAGATVTLTARHHHVTPPPATTVDDADVSVTTTDNGQYTFWFFADPTKDPPLPNELLVTAQSGALTGSLATPLTLTAGAVTNAPPIYLS